MNHRITLPALIAMLVSLIAAGCSGSNGKASYRKASGPTWGTTYNIIYKCDRDLDDSIKAVMAKVDGTLSMFNSESTVARLNRNEKVVVDEMFRTVFDTAREVNRLSNGYFDPTVSALVNLWGFGYKEGSEAPTDEQIATALATVGIAECSIDESGHVTKKTPDTQFDFSAIAKGYGCDMVAWMLERNGCTDYMIEIGGEMALKGVNERGEKWHIQIDAPVESRQGVHEQARLIAISDCGVATSGNYRNFRDTPAGRIGHTISPLTGYPAKGELLSVTVIAPDAMWADALATACMAMPLKDAYTMIRSLESVDALFITSAPDGGYMISATGGFPE